MGGERLLILGAGGHGKVAGDCARAGGLWPEIIFYDDRWPEFDACGPWSVAGKGEMLLAERRCNDEGFVAIGNAAARLAWLKRMRLANVSIATITHPRAIVSRNAVIGKGTLVVAGAVINVDARVGEGCIINTGATIDHDCVLSDGVHICPGAHIAGGVRVGSNSWIGIGSSVCQYLKIGCHVTVGAGAVVTKDVPDGFTVAGVPARPQKGKSKA